MKLKGPNVHHLFVLGVNSCREDISQIELTQLDRDVILRTCTGEWNFRLSVYRQVGLAEVDRDALMSFLLLTLRLSTEHEAPIAAADFVTRIGNSAFDVLSWWLLVPFVFFNAGVRVEEGRTIFTREDS